MPKASENVPPPRAKPRAAIARIEPLAVRAPEAAAMLGISESKLRGLVADGRVRPPIEIDRVRLFDVEQLRADWGSLRDAALAYDGANPWDEIAPSLHGAAQSKS
jgi:hypothetical protein